MIHLIDRSKTLKERICGQKYTKKEAVIQHHFIRKEQGTLTTVNMGDFCEKQF